MATPGLPKLLLLLGMTLLLTRGACGEARGYEPDDTSVICGPDDGEWHSVVSGDGSATCAAAESPDGSAGGSGGSAASPGGTSHSDCICHKGKCTCSTTIEGPDDSEADPSSDTSGDVEYYPMPDINGSYSMPMGQVIGSESEEDALKDTVTKSGPKEIGISVRSEEEEERILDNDIDTSYLQVSLNLEFLEAEFFLNSALGVGLDHIAPELVEGGPLPRGARRANLDKLTSNSVLQFALQEVGHLRAIKQTLGNYYFGRPQLDFSKEVFSDFIDEAFGEKLEPSFDVYANSVNYFLGAYMISYVGLTGYVGTSANYSTPAYKRRIAGLLAVEAGQDAVIREYLYERIYQLVSPYTHTVGDFTEKISAWRNYLSHERNVDEGLFVQVALGAERAVQGNVISADEDSLAYGRTPAQIFSTVYGTGDASQPGGFYPVGGSGKIAQQLLKKRPDL